MSEKDNRSNLIAPASLKTALKGAKPPHNPYNATANAS